MSVPGLYHDVRSREDLIAIAAAHSFATLPIPRDIGQPWTEWLLEYGRFVFDGLVSQREIGDQILAGTYSSLRLAQHLERVFAMLTDRGFALEEAAGFVIPWRRPPTGVGM